MVLFIKKNSKKNQEIPNSQKMNYFIFLTLISILLAFTMAMESLNPIHKGPVKFLFRDDKNPARRGNTYLHLKNVRIISQFENGVQKQRSCAVKISQADENVANGKWPIENEALPSFSLKWETCNPPVETMDQLNNMQIEIQYQFFNAEIKGPVDSPLLTQTVNFRDYVKAPLATDPGVLHYIFRGNVEVAIEYVQSHWPHFYLTKNPRSRGMAKFFLEIAGQENDKTIKINRAKVLFPKGHEKIDQSTYIPGCNSSTDPFWKNSGFYVNWRYCEQYVLDPEDLRSLSIEIEYSEGKHPHANKILKMPLKNVSAKILDAIYDGGEIKIVYSPNDGKPELKESHELENAHPTRTAKFFLEIAGQKDNETIRVTRPKVLFPSSNAENDGKSCNTSTDPQWKKSGFLVDWSHCVQYVQNPEDLRNLSIQFVYSGGNHPHEDQGRFAQLRKTAKRVYDRFYGVEEKKKAGIDVTVEMEVKLTMPLKNVSANVLDAIFDGGEIKIEYSPNDATVELEVVDVPKKGKGGEKKIVYSPNDATVKLEVKLICANRKNLDVKKKLTEFVEKNEVV